MKQLNEVLSNTLYKVTFRDGSTIIGNIDKVSSYFGDDDFIGMERMPKERQPKDLYNFFDALDKEEAKTNSHINVEDFYKIYTKE